MPSASSSIPRGKKLSSFYLSVFCVFSLFLGTKHKCQRVRLKQKLRNKVRTTAVVSIILPIETPTPSPMASIFPTQSVQGIILWFSGIFSGIEPYAPKVCSGDPSYADMPNFQMILLFKLLLFHTFHISIAYSVSMLLFRVHRD